MLNNSALKTLLNDKVKGLAATPEAVSVAANMMMARAGSRSHSIADGTVTLSFTMPLTEVAGFLARVQTLPPASVQTSHDRPQQPLPKSASEPVQAAAEVKTEPSTRLSDKQQSLIQSLARRKKLMPEQVRSLLQEQFGVADSSLLDRKQASQFISKLLA